jgi:hypothetical protein
MSVEGVFLPTDVFNSWYVFLQVAMGRLRDADSTLDTLTVRWELHPTTSRREEPHILALQVLSLPRDSRIYAGLNRAG